METRYVNNIFIIAPVKRTDKCYQPPSMGWVLGYPQTSPAFIEFLSSIMHKPNKNILCDNENNQSYNSECNNENNQK